MLLVYAHAFVTQPYSHTLLALQRGARIGNAAMMCAPPLSSKWKKNQWLGQMKQRGQEMKSKTERDGRQMDGARRNGAELDSFRLQTVAIHI